MARDPDAGSITLNYTGGSITMVVGNAKDLFGDDYSLLANTPVPYEKRVESHKRYRIIGGDESTVREHDRAFQKWPRSRASNAGTGKVIYMYWLGSEGKWSTRMTGTCAALMDFLSEASPKPVGFTTSRGSKYGATIAETGNDD